MKICFDLHDFSVVNNRFDLLLKLKEYYPNFKVSLFTIPVDEKRDFGPYLIRHEFLKQIKENLNWIQIIPHGYYHNGSEVKSWDYELTKSYLLKIEEAFNRDGLPFVKGFCAPHWRWNAEVVRALDDAGYWGAIDPRQPKMLSTKKFYKYSQAIDNIDMEQDILKLHGHINGTKNDLGLCFRNLLPYIFKEASWHFATEFLEIKE